MKAGFDYSRVSSPTATRSEECPQEIAERVLRFLAAN
jgi:hypothetical protein